MKRKFVVKASTSNADMLSVFEDKLAEFGPHVNMGGRHVMSASEVPGSPVEIYDEDYEEMYDDPQVVFGFGDYSLGDFKEYWNQNYIWDQSLQEYSTFDDWWSATRPFLVPLN